MMQWEYSIEDLTNDVDAKKDMVKHLNGLGNNGWELVALLESGYGIFKRPNPNQMQDPDAYFQYRTS